MSFTTSDQMFKSARIVSILGCAAGATLAAAGCTTGEPADDFAAEAPEAVIEGVEPQQIASDNGWTARAWATNISQTLFAYTEFKRTGGPTTRFAGVCAIRMHYPYQACVGTGYGQALAGECDDFPAGIPLGDRYCLAPDNTGTKYCGYKPGPNTTWCAGSPATGQPVSPATYSVQRPNQPVNSKWMARGCFEACQTVIGSNSLITSINPGF